MQGKRARLNVVDQMEPRVVAVEEEMERVKKELEVAIGQATALATNKKNLKKDVGTLNRRVGRRNTQLKSS